MEKLNQPDHDTVRGIIEGLHREEDIDYGTYSVLMDYVNECESLLDPEREV